MDTSIVTLQELLIAQDREDLADLLDRATSRLEPTATYGSHWHSFLTTFVLEVPPDIFVKIRDLSPEDYTLLCSNIKELHPPQEGGYEIESIVLNIQKTSSHDQENKRHLLALAQSWRKRAERMHEFSQLHYTKEQWAEAISAAQECIELSVKALALTITPYFSRDHDFSDNDCRSLIEQAPRRLKAQLPKLLLYVRFWRGLYAIAKYGHNGMQIGPEKLFDQAEADLALLHANACLTVAQNNLDTIVPKRPDEPATEMPVTEHTAEIPADSAPEPALGMAGEILDNEEAP